jgi:hypothetical protein
MPPTPLYHVWDYSDVDRAFWAEHFEDWLPQRIIDAHTHITDPRLRRAPITEAMRRQYWVNEVFEPITFSEADRCHATVFPGRELRCVAFGVPDLDFDLEAQNRYVREGCLARQWQSLAVVRPQWSAAQLASELAKPGVIGIKPYYALIAANRQTRDAHLEAGIFEFLPHHLLEVAHERHAWVTLHVPKAARLGHPDNLREIAELRRRYPNVALVIAHLGRCYTEAHARAGLPPLAEDPGIYVDTSAVLNPASHRVALECLGPERVLYGTDNPILYMRGHRQYRERAYVNRTNYPFYFNQEREPPEVEARYTLYMYEDLRALRQACADLGLSEPRHRAAIFHDNAARLIQRALGKREGTDGTKGG